MREEFGPTSEAIPQQIARYIGVESGNPLARIPPVQEIDSLGQYTHRSGTARQRQPPCR